MPRSPVLGLVEDPADGFLGNNDRLGACDAVEADPPIEGFC